MKLGETVFRPKLSVQYLKNWSHTKVKKLLSRVVYENPFIVTIAFRREIMYDNAKNKFCFMLGLDSNLNSRLL